MRGDRIKCTFPVSHARTRHWQRKVQIVSKTSPFTGPISNDPGKSCRDIQAYIPIQSLTWPLLRVLRFCSLTPGTQLTLSPKRRITIPTPAGQRSELRYNVLVPPVNQIVDDVHRLKHQIVEEGVLLVPQFVSWQGILWRCGTHICVITIVACELMFLRTHMWCPNTHCAPSACSMVLLQSSRFLLLGLTKFLLLRHSTMHAQWTHNTNAVRCV